MQVRAVRPLLESMVPRCHPRHNRHLARCQVACKMFIKHIFTQQCIANPIILTKVARTYFRAWDDGGKSKTGGAECRGLHRGVW